MLELALGLTTNEQVQVTLNGGVASHDFLLSALGISKDEVETFFDDPSLYGLRLYQALFPAGSQAEAGLKQLGLGERLALRLQDEQLNTLPWEYLYNGKYYLATEYALLRVVSPAGALPPAGPAQRLRLLFVPADPLLHRNQPAPYRLGVDAEWDELEAILQKADPAVDLVKTMPPTVQKLQDELPGMKGGIVHFTGHGSQQDDMAYLLFERLNGSSDPVETGRMASLLRGRTSLLVLSACQSAMPGEGTEANLAAQLCRQGAPWVLGMQLSVSDEAARHFTSTFYRFLFAGEDLCEALRQARLDVLADSALQMGIPVLYAADPARQGCLCPAGRGLQVAALPQPQLAGLPVLETRFFGRQHQLVELGTHLTRERLRQGQDYPPLAVTLHGPGGIGKTALLVQAAARFAWAFEGVLGLPLEPLEVSGVLLRLENYLGLADGGLLPLPQRYERLLEALRGRRLLLALDNFESVLHAAQGQGEEQPPDTQAAELYAFLGQLPGRGVTLLVSSREFSGLPGEAQVEVPGLKELPGAQLFRSLIIRRSHLLSEAGCLELSRAAGGHPLAIRLLGGLFESGEGDTLAEFVGQLDAFLLKAAKKVRRGGRHDTLESCFDFSLGFVARSSPELERALAHLSEFRLLARGEHEAHLPVVLRALP